MTSGPRISALTVSLACVACAAQPPAPPASFPPSSAGADLPARSDSLPRAAPGASSSPAVGGIVRAGRRFEAPSWPSSLAFDDRGFAYVSHGSGAFKLDLATGKTTSFPGGGMGDRFEVTDGRKVWRVGYSGASRYDLDGKHEARFAAPSEDWYTIPFTEDGEGNVWVGYDFGRKLYKYAPDGTRLLDLPVACGRGLIVDSHGDLVAGSSKDVVWLDPDGRELRRFPLGKNFNGFGLDREDHVWTYEQDEVGTIYRMSPAGEVRTFTPSGRKVRNLMVAPTGDVWFTGEVLSRNLPVTLHRMRIDGTYLGSYDLGAGVNAVALDQAGAVWVGYASTAPVGEAKAYYTGAVAEFVPVPAP